MNKFSAEKSKLTIIEIVTRITLVYNKGVFVFTFQKFFRKKIKILNFFSFLQINICFWCFYIILMC